MNPTTSTLLLLSVLLSTTSQIALKVGMGSAGVQRSIANGGVLEVAWATTSSPWVVGGLACFGLSAVTWLAVLSRLDVSHAYPCVALGFVLTVAAGHYLLGEPVNMTRVLGLAVILVGVALVALS
jgi:multidrug transporter EmrE-like cation transporter